MKKLTKKEFINRANSIHSNLYNYSKFLYTNSHSKSIINCSVHGDFLQNPTNHLSGQGCRKCNVEKFASTRRKSRDNFILKSKLKHGDKYDYSKSIYHNDSTNVTITCPLHGDFEQTPNNHYKKGCYNCGVQRNTVRERKDASGGWRHSTWIQASIISKYFDSFKVYIIKCWNEEEEFYKIGRTFLTVNRRFRKFPYQYKIIKIFEDKVDGVKICQLETQLKKINSKDRYIPNLKFGGMYECFSEVSF